MRRKRSKFGLMAIALTALVDWSGHAAANEPASGGVPVEIHVLSCRALSSAADVQLAAFENYAGPPKLLVPVFEHQRDNLYSLRFNLRAGNYRIDLTTQGCGDSFDLTVLGGHERSITSFMYRGGLDYHNHGTISGTLPITGINVFAKCDADANGISHEFPAVIDRDAYYFNNLPDCDYRLFVSFAFSTIETSLAKQIAVTSLSRGAVFDVSLQMLEIAGRKGLPFGTRLL